MTRFIDKLIAWPTLSLVVLFVCLDALGGFLYYLFMNDVLESRFFRLGRDRGYFELVEYAKTFLIISIFRRVWLVSKAPVMHAWWILFWVILLDNALELHEQIGGFLTPYFAQIGLLSEHAPFVSELFVFACLEGLALLYVIYAYFISDTDYQSFTRYFVALLVSIAALSFCVEFLSMSHLEETVEILGFTVLMAFVHIRFKSVCLQSNISSFAS